MADYTKLLEEFQKDPEGFVKNKENIKAFINGLKAVASNPNSFKSSEELSALYNEWQRWAMSTPQGKQAVTDMLRDKQTDRFVKRNKPLLDGLVTGADIATSISQIRQSNKAIRELRRPTFPSPTVLDPAINNAIAKAQQGSLEALRALEPAKQEIAQQKLADLQIAKSISGGQAGAFGAQATAGNLRAMRAASGLPIIGDQIRARQQQNLNTLLGLRQGVLQNEFNNRMSIANANMEQYQNDAAAAAALGQAGRTNLRMSIGQLPELLTRTAGGMLPVNTAWDTYGDQVKNNLAQSISANSLSINPTIKPFNGVNPINPMDYDRYGRTIQSSRQQRLNALQNYTGNNYTRFNLGYPQNLKF